MAHRQKRCTPKTRKRVKGCTRKTIFTPYVCKNGRIIRPRRRKVLKFTVCK